MNYTLLPGDNRLTLKTLADNSIDSIVTDPPYGIEFLGKAWDVNTGELETYQECLRVLKPGGYILAFSAAGTYHHLAMTLENAGFEIRDQIMWIYSSGFPKSQDVGKNNNLPDWEGWGTQLKPAHEPICLARKPTGLSFADNVQTWNVGALNIDAARIPADDLQDLAKWHARYQYTSGNSATFNNVLSEAQGKPRQKHQGEFDSTQAQEDILKGRFPSNVIGEIADYQKYFFCPKPNKQERHLGIANNHPTVKPVDLMKYLIKLVTPPGGTVLDPYNGSGTTGMAAVELGYAYIGCELDPNYIDISHKRISAWKNNEQFNNLFTWGAC